MKRTIIILMAVIFAFATIAQNSNQEQYKAARKLYDAKKYEEAYPIFKALAEKGDKDGERLMGHYYYFGSAPVRQDYAQALSWYKKAAEQGDETAIADLGQMYYDGEGVAQNYETAFKLFQKAAAKGDEVAMTFMGIMHDFGIYVEQDYKKAYEWYVKAADKGNNVAMLNLGELYARGNYVKQNHEKAYEWYKKAADKGNVTAMTNIGVLYEQGMVPGSNGESDPDNAAKWYKKAADKGDIRAMVGLAYLYIYEAIDEQTYFPKGYPITGTFAHAAPKKEEIDNSMEAGADLPYNTISGHIKYTEDDIKDLRKPIIDVNGKINLNIDPVTDGERWLLRAAKQDSAYGLYYLTYYYAIHPWGEITAEFRGIDTETNEGKRTIEKLYKTAADNGSTEAQVMCGWISLINGNNSTAIKWMNQAKENGALEASYYDYSIDIDAAIMICKHFMDNRDYTFIPRICDGKNIKDGYVYVSVKDKRSDKCGLLKLSSDGKVLARTPMTSDERDLVAFDYDEQMYYYQDENGNKRWK